jgi:hypothetical protein
MKQDREKQQFYNIKAKQQKVYSVTLKNPKISYSPVKYAVVEVQAKK